MIVRSNFRMPIELRIHELADNGDGLGIQVARPVGDAVVLRPGLNHVDAEFWRAWSGQNKDGVLISHFAIEDAV